MRYLVTGFFESDRPLTGDELRTLSARLEVELGEPTDWDSERAEWTRVGDYSVVVVPS